MWKGVLLNDIIFAPWGRIPFQLMRTISHFSSLWCSVYSHWNRYGNPTGNMWIDPILWCLERWHFLHLCEKDGFWIAVWFIRSSMTLKLQPSPSPSHRLLNGSWVHAKLQIGFWYGQVADAWMRHICSWYGFICQAKYIRLILVRHAYWSAQPCLALFARMTCYDCISWAVPENCVEMGGPEGGGFRTSFSKENL